jgi:lysophospholipase L1-like esterase
MLGFLLAWIPVRAVPFKIACVGDSITQGTSVSNPTLESFPAKLQRLLGTNYNVRNFGVSGRTLLKQGDFPYWKDPAFKTSHDFAPDLVLIQLGTNDSKPYNWRYGTNFVADYEALIASYTALTSSPRIVVCTPCPVYNKGVFDITPGIVATNIAPLIRDIASRLNLQLVDLHTRMDGHKEWFPDTVHPNAKGFTVMTALIYSTLAGGAPDEPPPSLGLTQPAANRLALTWPASWRGLVPLSTSALRESNTVWSVVEPAIYLDGGAVRQTNIVSGSAPRIYKLWQP